VVELLEIVVGILVALIMGPVVGWVLKLAHLKLEKPDGIGEEIWEALQPKGIEHAGKWLASLERLVALASAWTGHYELVAGWLAFKVASKWEVWTNVLKVPESLPDIAPLQYLRVRRVWGSMMLMRFLVGTLSNVLLGVLAAYIGQHTWEVFQAMCVS
jgi:energy-converting hydrogenase Eha subunit A